VKTVALYVDSVNIKCYCLFNVTGANMCLKEKIMKIAILYESSDPQADMLYYALSKVCTAPGNIVETIDASKKELKECIGCFTCWIKTPGICVHTKDGGQDYLYRIFDADYFLILSRITWGGYSTGIKYYADRMIPLLHPYFRKLNGEMHHKIRYDKMPVLLSAGFGAAGGKEGIAEENTFRKFTEAHRDNTGSKTSMQTYILNYLFDTDEKQAAEHALSDCVNWLAGEIIK
jgi:multimeric flavodoxin WrbA